MDQSLGPTTSIFKPMPRWSPPTAMSSQTSTTHASEAASTSHKSPHAQGFSVGVSRLRRQISSDRRRWGLAVVGR